MASTLLLSVAASVACLLLLKRFTQSSQSSLPLPPGPRPLPLIGNVHQAPPSHPWKQYHEWGKQYGPLVYLNMMGQSIVLLTTSGAAHELLAKRGATFSDRAYLLRAQLALKGTNTLLMSYTPRFKMHQKLEGFLLDQRATQAYQHLQVLESRQLLFDLLGASNDNGIDCHKLLERSTASTLFMLNYGFRIKSAEDHNLQTIHAIDDDFSDFFRIGSQPVDLLPFLNHLPASMAPWKTKAEAHWKMQTGLHMPNLQRGINSPGWTAAKLAWDKVQRGELEFTFQDLALEFGTMIDAALDGTVETLAWFLIACLTQDRGFVSKAQKELDEVVGRGRLPSFEDRPRLPQIGAILEETLRWRPVGAGGVPHFTKPESTYNGYRIPANSLVIPVQWAINREEAIFGSNAEDFVPERWLSAETGHAEPVAAAFGFGRRTCPGRHFARNSLWLSMAYILWAFNIKPARDPKTGKAIPLDSTAAMDGLVMRPEAFKVGFEPRDQTAKDLIQKEGSNEDKLGETLCSYQ